MDPKTKKIGKKKKHMQILSILKRGRRPFTISLYYTVVRKKEPPRKKKKKNRKKPSQVAKSALDNRLSKQHSRKNSKERTSE